MRRHANRQKLSEMLARSRSSQVICTKDRKRKAFQIRNMTNFVPLQYLLYLQLCVSFGFGFSPKNPHLDAGGEMPTQYKQS